MNFVSPNYSVAEIVANFPHSTPTIANQVEQEFYRAGIDKIETSAAEGRGGERAYRQAIWCWNRAIELKDKK